jgi:hypothetical protein
MTMHIMRVYIKLHSVQSVYTAALGSSMLLHRNLAYYVVVSAALITLRFHCCEQLLCISVLFATQQQQQQQQQAPENTMASSETLAIVHSDVADDVASTAVLQPYMQVLFRRLHGAAFVREFQQWLQRTRKPSDAVSVRSLQCDLESWEQFCSIQNNSAGAELARYTKNRVARIAKRANMVHLNTANRGAVQRLLQCWLEDAETGSLRARAELQQVLTAFFKCTHLFERFMYAANPLRLTLQLYIVSQGLQRVHQQTACYAPLPLNNYLNT